MKFKNIYNKINEADEFDSDMMQLRRMGSGWIEANIFTKFKNYLKMNKNEIIKKVEQLKNSLKFSKSIKQGKYQIDDFSMNIFSEFLMKEYNKKISLVDKIEQEKILKAAPRIIMLELNVSFR